MSIKVLNAVWESAQHSGGDLLVLLAIADNATDDGRAWPSIATIARKARMTERNVQRNIARLVESGVLVVERGTGRHLTNTYIVNLDALSGPPDPEKDDKLSGNERATSDGKGDNAGGERVTIPAERVTPASPGGDAHVTRTVIEPRENESSLSPFQNFPAVFDCIRRATGATAKAFHDDVERRLVAAGFDVVREYLVPDRGDGQRGFIDLVAMSDGEGVAIELDQVSPREKSIFKLSQFPGSKVIGLRESGGSVHAIPGIDAIIVAGQPQPDHPATGDKPSRRKPETPAPEHFPLTTKHYAFAAEHGLDVRQTERETENFLDHHRAKDTRFRDWEAAWRTWIRNARVYQPASAPRPKPRVATI